MSIIDNVERYMKRYDYLMQKRERQYSKGKRLSQEEDVELLKLRPNVVTPILVMFELLHETVKKNQTIRTQNKHIQSGGGNTPSPSAIAIAAIATSEASNAPGAAAAAAKTDSPKEKDDDKKGSSKDDEAQRLSELEESLLPLLTKIIVYIEQNKDKDKKKEEEEEERNIQISEPLPKIAQF